MDHRDKLFDIVKQKGPLLPAQINKELHTNVLFASAMLAEMVDNKKLKLTSMKVGGSPLYYCDGQENLLENFANKLNDSNHKAFEILKSIKVVRDRDQETDIRVSLREIKDFAVPLEVTANGSADLFWKYYLVSDDEAKALIANMMNAMYGKKEKKHGEHHKKSVSVSVAHGADVDEIAYSPAVSFSTVIDTDEKVKLEKKRPLPAIVEEKMVVFPQDDSFFERVKAFFDASGISITDFSLVKKGSEFDFVINLPTNIGSICYYCKAKSKAKINDIDISTAFVKGTMKKLPIVYLTDGELTKGAKELLNKEFRNMFVRKFE
jgi:hypothetical protein